MRFNQSSSDISSMMLWATRASSVADRCLLNSDPAGLCLRVWCCDFKVAYFKTSNLLPVVTCGVQAGALFLSGLHKAGCEV